MPNEEPGSLDDYVAYRMMEGDDDPLRLKNSGCCGCVVPAALLGLGLIVMALVKLA